MAEKEPGFYEFFWQYQSCHSGAAGVYLKGDAEEPGWILNRKYQGNGFAYEEVRAVAETFSAYPGIRSFAMHDGMENAASFRNTEKPEMSRTG